MGECLISRRGGGGDGEPQIVRIEPDSEYSMTVMALKGAKFAIMRIDWSGTITGGTVVYMEIIDGVCDNGLIGNSYGAGQTPMDTYFTFSESTRQLSSTSTYKFHKNAAYKFYIWK